MTALAKRTEVLNPGQRSLRELADDANREHGLVLEAGASMVEHAIRAGEALIAAQEQLDPGLSTWTRWLRENFDQTQHTAALYMRLATYQDLVRGSGHDGIVAARQHLAEMGAPARRKGPKVRLPDWMREAAHRLRENGWSQSAIARELGVAQPTVGKWLNPDLAQRQKAAVQEARRRQRAAEKSLREQERASVVKLAVRKAGAATQEAWAMAERMQDVLAQAQHETQDREARESLARAGVHYRQMRDQIVRALGVA